MNEKTNNKTQKSTWIWLAISIAAMLFFAVWNSKISKRQRALRSEIEVLEEDFELIDQRRPILTSLKQEVESIDRSQRLNQGQLKRPLVNRMLNATSKPEDFVVQSGTRIAVGHQEEGFGTPRTHKLTFYVPAGVHELCLALEETEFPSNLLNQYRAGTQTRPAWNLADAHQRIPLKEQSVNQLESRVTSTETKPVVEVYLNGEKIDSLKLKNTGEFCCSTQRGHGLDFKYPSELSRTNLRGLAKNSDTPNVTRLFEFGEGIAPRLKNVVAAERYKKGSYFEVKCWIHSHTRPNLSAKSGADLLNPNSKPIFLGFTYKKTYEFDPKTNRLYQLPKKK